MHEKRKKKKKKRKKKDDLKGKIEVRGVGGKKRQGFSWEYKDR